MGNRILVIDLSAVLHSVKFSLGKHKLSNNEKPTFVIYGFILKLRFLIQKTHPDIIVYAIDSKASKRKKIYSPYKEKRAQDKTDAVAELDELAFPQFQEIIDYVIPTIGYSNIMGADGFEADDVIAKISKKYATSEVVIASTDRDLYQLLTRNVCMFNIKSNKWYSERDFKKEYNIEPKMWKRVKAIGGCSSDCVEGVPGVGEKTAIKFITGNLPEHYKTYQAIMSDEGRRVINRNKTLVILPFKNTPEFTISRDFPKLTGLQTVCSKYGFQSILGDLSTWRTALKLR